METSCARILLLFAAVVAAVGSNPGFKARITQRGLTYANQVAVKALSAQISKLKIPDQSGKSGHISYTVSNMQVRGFTPPSSSMPLVAGRGVRWTMSGAGLSMHGDFKYKLKKLIPIHGHGSFDLTISGLSISLTMNIGNSAGRPKMTGTGCTCSINKLKVKFHGGASWFYNLFSKLIAKKIKGSLQGKLCGVATNAININANAQLAKLPMTVKLLKGKFLLDYSLMANPTFTTKYLETQHKGEVYWNGDKKECPLSPPPIPTNGDTSRMLYLWISDYMGNSLAYTGFKHGFLQYNLTAKDLPPGNRSLLNTTCTNLKCIGTVIPEIGKKYPNTQVMLRMYATSAPLINITGGLIGMNISGNLDLYVPLPGGKTAFLLSITCAFKTKVSASIQGQLIKAHVSNPSIQVNVKNSTVGPVSTFMLQMIMNMALNNFILPTLNAQGAKGLVLPVTENVRFVNAKLSILQDTLLIATDLSYSSDEELARSHALREHLITASRLKPAMTFDVIDQRNRYDVL